MLARIGVVLVAGAPVLAALLASAASLGGISAAPLAPFVSTVTICDEDGVALSYASAADAPDEPAEIVELSVSGIAPDCGEASLWLALTADGTALALHGPITVPSGGGSIGGALRLVPPGAQVDAAHVLIAGSQPPAHQSIAIGSVEAVLQVLTLRWDAAPAADVAS